MDIESPIDFRQAQGTDVIIIGKLQTYKNEADHQVDTFILADYIRVGSAIPQNDIAIKGKVFKNPTLRKTMRGVDIANMILLVPSEFDEKYEYEVRACQRMLAEGKLECEEMPHAETLRIMKLMDSLRKDWGVRYPFD